MREINNVFGALLLLSCSGMHMGWSLLNPRLWEERDGNILVLISAVIFFIGSVLGTVIANRELEKRTIKQIQLASAILLGTAGILCILPQDGLHIVMMLNKLLAGLGHGAIYFFYTKQSSEIAPTHRRGWLIGLNPVAVFIGVFVYYGLEEIAAERSVLFMGIVSVVDSIMAAVFVYHLSADSPLHVLQTRNEDACRQSIKNLRKNEIPSQDDERATFESNITGEIEELKEFVETGSMQAPQQWKRWFWLIVLFKMLAVSSFNYYMNIIISTGFRLSDKFWGMALFPVARIASHLMGAAAVDTFGRFSLCLIWCISTSYCFLCVGISILFEEWSFKLADVIMLQLHLLAAYGYSFPDIFSAEWFPVHVRQNMIALTSVLEPVYHIIITSVVFLLRNPLGHVYMYSTAFILCGFALLMCFVALRSVKETKLLSLADIAKGKTSFVIKRFY